MKRICILGSTGSIGTSTLDVISRHPDEYKVVALTAHRSVDRLFEQCCAFLPDYAVLDRESDAEALRRRLDNEPRCRVEVLSGSEALQKVAALDDVDFVMAAIVGAAGLLSTLAAARAGKRLMLANKEALVMSGALLMQAVQECDAELLPIDSEHNAIFQAMPARGRPGLLPEGVRRVLLTASGGPFLGWSQDQLQAITPQQACKHPNWSMGRKISVDSATMMNKGLEVIEAKWLFGLSGEQIQVVVHPQSIIHSMVDYVDGSVLAQLGNPDMRTPIAHALAWPDRIHSGVSALDLFAHNSLTFEPACIESFPCLRLAYEALETGGTASSILNAANEVAVDAFLHEKIKFLDIPVVIEHCLNKIASVDVQNIETVLHADRLTRSEAQQYLSRFV